jgi:hypothetical protein
MAEHPGGYDSPQSKREDDFLDRWRFAAELFAVVRDTPAECVSGQDKDRGNPE